MVLLPSKVRCFGSVMAKIPSFPEEGLKFLKGLKRNNKRAWFQPRKAIYEEFVRRPMEAIVDALAPEFKRFAPDFQASRKASLFRIYRDTRFSKDKSPYKIHVAAGFPPVGIAQHRGAGFYFHISATEFYIGGGLYMPEPRDLQAVRSHIAENLRAFEKIVKAPSFRRLFGEVSGSRLERVPRGFARDHPAEHYLRFRQLLATRSLPVEMVTSAKFGPTLLETFRALYPFIRFVNEPIRNLQKQRGESYFQNPQ